MRAVQGCVQYKVACSTRLEAGVRHREHGLLSVINHKPIRRSSHYHLRSYRKPISHLRWGVTFDSSFVRLVGFLRLAEGLGFALRDSTVVSTDCSASPITSPSVEAHISISDHSGSPSCTSLVGYVRFVIRETGAVLVSCLRLRLWWRRLGPLARRRYPPTHTGWRGWSTILNVFRERSTTERYKVECVEYQVVRMCGVQG